MTWWTLVRFLHVVGAATWVGGQITISALLLPVVRKRFAPPDRSPLLQAVGRRFAMFTVLVFLPLQVATGVALAVQHDVELADLGRPGYGRRLAIKVTLFAVVLLVTGTHGWASGSGRPKLARGLAMGTLLGSLGIVLLAVSLVS